jgi:SAM-dependent methyltransferase
MDDDGRRLELSFSLKQFCHPDLDPFFWTAERRGSDSAWWGHVPFAHWLMCAVRARLFVELGTYTGVSYTAFCQAVERCNLGTRCFAVDTWKGDEHQSFYDESVYDAFRAAHDFRYAYFSTLVRSTFDEALNRFVDGSIDLLHIDGLHTYDAVRHDYESWLPKLSRRGVVLFHDINVHHDDFGIWRLWQELSQQHAHFEFDHSYGLGLLAIGDEPPQAVTELCAMNGTAEGAALRARAALIGERWVADAREHALHARVLHEQQARSPLEAAKAVSEAARIRAEAVLSETEERARTAKAEGELCRITIEQLRCNQAALEQAIADLQTDNHRLRAIEQSTTWRTTAALRRIAARLPEPVRHNLRRAATATSWALKPHGIPAHRSLRREGLQQDSLSSPSIAVAESVNKPASPQMFLPPDWLNRGPIVTEDEGFTCSIDEIIAFRDILFLSGSAEHRDRRQIVAVFVVFHNSVQRISTGCEPGKPLRFDFRLTLPPDQPNADIKVGFEFQNGVRFCVETPFRQSWLRDPYFRVFQKFVEGLREINQGQILEIGSRARSGNVYREFVPEAMKYVGMDIVEGPNVDVIGDAHELSRYFAPESFDAVYSIAVFEHLLMPWKVAIELNKILKSGGIAYLSSPQTFNVHEEPWDFFRFSDKAWHALFNKFTGFEIIDAAMGERAYIVGSFLNGMTYRMDRAPAFLNSTVFCRKIGPCNEQWHADLPSLVDSFYPH